MTNFNEHNVNRAARGSSIGGQFQHVAKSEAKEQLGGGHEQLDVATSVARTIASRLVDDFEAARTRMRQAVVASAVRDIRRLYPDAQSVILDDGLAVEHVCDEHGDVVATHRDIYALPDEDTVGIRLAESIDGIWDDVATDAYDDSIDLDEAEEWTGTFTPERSVRDREFSATIAHAGASKAVRDRLEERAVAARAAARVRSSIAHLESLHSDTDFRDELLAAAYKELEAFTAIADGN